MPPKAKVVKEQIVDKAFSILRKEGFQGLTVRRLAGELGCSTQPIYYYFSNMEELKKELYVKAREFFVEYVRSIELPASKESQFLEAGVAYIKGAKQENQLFHFICLEHNYALEEIHDLMKGTHLSLKESDLFLNLWLYAHGIACIVANNDVPVNEDEVRTLLTRAFLGFEKVV